MVETFTLLFFVLLLIAAVLGIQVSEESSLALKVKKFLFLSQPYNKKLLPFMHFNIWRRIIGTAFYFLLPLVIIFVVLLRLHFFISELLDCPMCSATWIYFFLLYFFTTETIVYCILFAPLSIIGVYILNRLRR
jgi:hypothetical protein